MNKENYTSLKFSKWLQDKEFIKDSSFYWVMWYCKWELKEANDFTDEYSSLKEKYPAYDILNDLCVKYSEKIFGTGDDMVSPSVKCYEILKMIRRGKKEEAEQYIMDNSIIK